jgi:purine-nucleoside/S-methyl-5'-thioadenosine phosphorylase / adenosine deaminase
MVHPKPSGGFEWVQAPWGAVLRCLPLLEVADHFFTAADLQLRGDDDEWNALAGLLGVGREQLLLIRQVHGAAVAVAHRDRPELWRRPEADVVASDDPSKAIAIRVADCAPVLVGDRRTGAVAAAHAGWRGTVQGAAVAAVETLRVSFGSEPSDLVAAVGPCLGPCCGEVGPEVVQAFIDAGHNAASIERWFSTGASGRPYLDLWRANADQLEAAGVPREHVHVAGLCTRTHSDVFHSYRAAREQAGRMVGAIRARSMMAAGTLGPGF